LGGGDIVNGTVASTTVPEVPDDSALSSSVHRGVGMNGAETVLPAILNNINDSTASIQSDLAQRAAPQSPTMAPNDVMTSSMMASGAGYAGAGYAGARPYVGSLSDAHVVITRPAHYHTGSSSVRSNYFAPTTSSSALAASSENRLPGLYGTSMDSISNTSSRRGSSQSLYDYRRQLNEISRQLDLNAHRRLLTRRHFFDTTSGGGGIAYTPLLSSTPHDSYGSGTLPTTSYGGSSSTARNAAPYSYSSTTTYLRGAAGGSGSFKSDTDTWKAGLTSPTSSAATSTRPTPVATPIGAFSGISGLTQHRPKLSLRFGNFETAL